MKKRMTLLLAGLTTMLLVLTACQSGGVSSDDAAAIRQQLEDVANRLDVVEDRIEDIATDAGGDEMLISQVRRELDQARTTLADVDDKLAESDNEAADDGLTNDGLNDDTLNDDGFGDPLDDDPLNDLGNDAQDTLDDAGDSLNQLGDDVNEGMQQFGDDLNDGMDDLQDNLNDNGLDEDMNDSTTEPTPAQPGTGGGAGTTAPGVPPASGM